MKPDFLENNFLSNDRRIHSLRSRPIRARVRGQTPRLLTSGITFPRLPTRNVAVDELDSSIPLMRRTDQIQTEGEKCRARILSHRFFGQCLEFGTAVAQQHAGQIQWRSFRCGPLLDAFNDAIEKLLCRKKRLTRIHLANTERLLVHLRKEFVPRTLRDSPIAMVISRSE